MILKYIKSIDELNNYKKFSKFIFHENFEFYKKKYFLKFPAHIRLKFVSFCLLLNPKSIFKILPWKKS